MRVQSTAKPVRTESRKRKRRRKRQRQKQRIRKRSQGLTDFQATLARLSFLAL